MQLYNVVVELDTPHDKIDDEHADEIVDRFVGYHPALNRGAFGQAELVISLPAETLRQATTTGIALISGLLPEHNEVTLAAMTAEEFDRRAGLDPVGELLSVSEAAAELGVSRQRILQRIENGRIPATRVGTSWVISRSAVEADRARKASA